MLSISCKASIKAVIFLGTRFASGKRSGILEVAEYINENEHTVGKLLQTLVKSDIIKSIKGPAGGFYMTAEQLEQPTIRIVEAIDGLDFFNQCGLGLSQCSDTKPCPFHEEFKEIRDDFKKMLENHKIHELYNNVEKGLAFLI